MSKRYTASEVKAILFEILSNAYANIDALSDELRKLDSKGEGKLSVVDSDPDTIAKGRLYSNTILLLNTMVSPAHEISLQLFDKKHHDFIKNCISQQKKWMALQEDIKNNQPNIDPMDFSTTEKEPK